MKKLFIWLATIIVTVIIGDLVLGYLFDRYMTEHGLPGDYESIDHVMRHNDSDILILGSSVGLNSVNAKQIEDSIGWPTFNGSANGQTFPFFLTMLKAAVQQPHKPRLVLLFMTPTNLSGSDNGSRYNFLAPYYGMSISDIDQRLEEKSPYESIFLKSNAYRLNTIWFRIMLYNFISAGIKGENGTISKPVPSSFPQRLPYNISEMSQRRMNELNEFIDICNLNNIDLIIIFPPQYLELIDTVSDPVANYIGQVAADKGTKLYNDIYLQPFVNDSTLFYDNIHININGTDIYTPIIIDRIKAHLNETD